MNYSNNGFSVLRGAVAPGDTIIALAAGTGSRFPASDFLVTLIGYDELGNENKWEICKCSSRAGDVLTVVRAQEGTTASAWPDATRIENRITAGSMAALEPTITPGTTAQYLRGDKTWRDFFTDVRASLSATGAVSYNAATGVISAELTSGYASKTVAANTTLAADTEYETGRNLRINHGVKLTVPNTTLLIVRKYAAGSSL